MALDTPRTGTRPSGDGPRYAVNRDATPPGVFREQRGRFVANRTSCATFFRPISSFTTAWGILLRQSSRSAQSKLDYSEKWQRTTRPVDHEVAGAWGMAGMWAGSGDSSHLVSPVRGSRPISSLRSASMRSQHLLRRNLNLHLWIPRLIPATIKKPNRTVVQGR